MLKMHASNRVLASSEFHSSANTTHGPRHKRLSEVMGKAKLQASRVPRPSSRGTAILFFLHKFTLPNRGWGGGGGGNSLVHFNALRVSPIISIVYTWNLTKMATAW